MSLSWLRLRAFCLPAGALVVAACGGGGGGGGGGSSTGGAYPPIPPGPIKIGFVAPLSGPNAQSGQFLLAGYTLFVGLVNQQGGIAGHQIQLVSGDDKADPATGAAEARRLVEQEHVAAFLEPGTGETTFQVVPVLTKAKIPTVAVLPENELDNPRTYPYYFSDYPLNSDSAKEIVKYAKTLGITKLAIARDTTGFGDSYEPVIRKQAAADGITITDTQSFDIGAVDVTTQMRKLRDTGANGLTILSVGAVVGHVYDALKAIGWTPPIVGTYSLLYSGTTSLGNLAKTTFFSCGVGIPEGQQPDPQFLQLVQLQNQRIARLPTNAGGVWSHDSIEILKAAIEKYKSLDPDAIKSAIESMHGVSFTSPRFTYTFSPDEHDGWPPSQLHMCRLDTFSPDLIPIYAPNS